MADEPQPEPDEPNTEAVRVRRWRRVEAMQAGMTGVEARLYAESDIFASDLRKLVKRGCPQELLARILL